MSVYLVAVSILISVVMLWWVWVGVVWGGLMGGCFWCFIVVERAFALIGGWRGCLDLEGVEGGLGELLFVVCNVSD